MFNFHKPRTYRSAEGCCICKAKSSSSRFTDSRKYEKDTMQCFDLKYPRQGEICNACVLLVKRFKRLPVGSKRNWSHIVDAKAAIGPGYNKVQTKYKSERINSKAAAQQMGNISTAAVNTSNIAITGAASNTLNSLCFVPEKFSKIFKKSKKLKEVSSPNNPKRKPSNNGWSQSNTQFLPTTPDSLDSDYEDSRIHSSLSGNPGSGTVVQFQTQTRASAYKAHAAAVAKMKIIKLGTKRRKCLTPRKYHRSASYEESLPFFDDGEWRKRKSCCGILYECTALSGALLIDTENFQPCQQHRQERLTTCQETPKQLQDEVKLNNNNIKKPTALPLPKSCIQTMPAVVQLQPPQSILSSSSLLSSTSSFCSNSISKTSATSVTTPTPVLKKHHLFFKRQSECFPQGDIVTVTNNNYNDTNTLLVHSAKSGKTQTEQNQNQHHHNQQQRQQNNITLQRHIENAMHSSSQSHQPSKILTDSLNSLALSVSVTSSSTLSIPSSSASIPSFPQMPKHSLAKVTTISPPLTTSIQQTYHHYNANGTNSLPLVKPSGMLHKVKSDCGKIVKHSLEKFNTAVRLKTSDVNEIKPIVRPVEKSYILAKPTIQANITPLNATNTTSITYQSMTAYNTSAPSHLTTTLSASSPTSSTSSTSSNKFSDNSSDSGFDENMLDRKSASPLQEDCEKKILSRPGVQTMFLANGVQIQGQPQNLVLAGNEVATKILQNRKYSTLGASSTTASLRTLTSNHNPTTTSVKIAQISTNPLLSTSSSVAGCVVPQMSMSSAAQAKMRAIYNNNNTIQHENGITTIVPASSLAATTQTAAMQNIAPSTVTITPAPPVGAQFNPQNVISRKLTTANIINLQSNTNNLSNSHNNNTSGNHHHLSSINSSSNNHNNMTNQKIILLKTAPNDTTTVAASASYKSLPGGGVGHLNNAGGGR